MPKPGRREAIPSADIARFTDREDHRARYSSLLHSIDESPVLMFYGIGGAGKSWLLKKLREETPQEIPTAFLDFAIENGGQQFVLEPSLTLREIRNQLKQPAPRFDMAFGMMRYKQGSGVEPDRYSEGVGLALEVAAEIAKKAVEIVPGATLPGAGAVIGRLSKTLWGRIKGLPLGEYLSTKTGSEFTLKLDSRTWQDIGKDLLHYLAGDLKTNLPVPLNRAARAVIFFDTYEAVSSGLRNKAHKHLREQWIRDLAANFEFALTVIAGQNRLNWHEADPNWATSLEQRLVGGLSEADAREFLARSGIDTPDLQAAILRTAYERDSGGYHCFSLGLCADIVHAERSNGREPAPETLSFRPQDWQSLAQRFLKSLPSDADARWVEQLALTPTFDEAAARSAYSRERSVAQDAAWDALPAYSFVDPLAGRPGWFAIRAQMRRALEKQSPEKRILSDHGLWRELWSKRSQASADEGASFDVAALAWYHHYLLEPSAALAEWNRRAGAARRAVPPKMREHFDLVRWWEPLGLLDVPASSAVGACACLCLGTELSQASLGSRDENLRQAIACSNVALRTYTEKDFPQAWGMTQNSLGAAWADLPSGNRDENLRQAIACYEAALRIRTEKDFPGDWATTQNNLGNAWAGLPSGNRDENLRQAIACYDAALRMRTEKDFPEAWAMTQNNLGAAWADLPSGNRDENLRQAIVCYGAALRVCSEKNFPMDWATTQNNLGNAWQGLPSGNRDENLRQAIACYDAALRMRTEKDFPEAWAMTQNNLGAAWADLPSGNRGENLRQAIVCYDAALQVYSEKNFPMDWAMTQNNLGNAWQNLPSGNRDENLREAIGCYDAALRVYTEKDFPMDWAMTQNNLGLAWSNLPSGNQAENLQQAIACYNAALRVRTEKDFPTHWGMTQNSLGNAWADLPSGNRDENLRQAIGCYDVALRVYTEKDFPMDWAMTQNNLGLAWSKLASGSRDENLRQAIGCYDAALRVYTEENFPLDHAGVMQNVQKIHFK